MIGTNELLQLLDTNRDGDVLAKRCDIGVTFVTSSPAELAATMFHLALEAGAAGADMPGLIESIEGMTTRDGEAFDLIVEIPATPPARTRREEPTPICRTCELPGHECACAPCGDFA